MKVLIVEEALKTLHGHWFQYISDIVNGGREAGHEIEVAVHKGACPEILRSLPCRPILSSTVFEKNTASGLKRVLTHNLSLYRDLRKFFSAGNSYDVVIATTPRLDHLLAYELLQLRFRERKQQWVLIFVEAVGKYSADYSELHFSKKMLPLKMAMKFSRWLPQKNRFSLVTESTGLARQFKKFCGIDFALVPHVTHLPPLETYRARYKPDKNSITLGTFGFTRYDKGIDVLQSAIKRLPSPRNDDIGFVIQWTGDYRLPDGSLVHAEPLPGTKYIPPFTGSDEYFEWIARTDMMVLPYRKDFYFDKLSRVAIDAALAGMPIIYPKGTWLEEFAQTHAAGIGFIPENAESLAKAIESGIANFSGLKTLAESKKTATAEAFSARTFFEIIAGLRPGTS